MALSYIQLIFISFSKEKYHPSGTSLIFTSANPKVYNHALLIIPEQQGAVTTDSSFCPQVLSSPFNKTAILLWIKKKEKDQSLIISLGQVGMLFVVLGLLLLFREGRGEAEVWTEY